MKVLVTGGAGFIGAVTVRELLKAGYDVVVFDNLICGHRETIPKNVKLVEADLRIPSDIDNALASEKFDAVLHFAAFTMVPESMENPIKYFENNVYASINLLNAMVKYKVKRIVFSSSAAVYGEPKELPVSENAPTSPANTYGETKRTVEQYLKWYEIAYGIKYISLRYFNAAGADLENDIGEDREIETHLIPLLIRSAMGIIESVPIFGSDYPTRDGTCIRDYIHVKDLANAHVLSLNSLFRDGANSEIYNLGSEKGFSVREIVKAVENVTGHKPNTIDTLRRTGDPPALVASSKKIRDKEPNTA